MYWRSAYCQEALEEFMQLEGQGVGSDKSKCPMCSESKGPGHAIYRCEECLGTYLECQECVVERHGHNPFHIIQVITFPFYGLMLN